MVEVEFTPGGWGDLATLGFSAKIDVIHKLELVEQVGLRRELKIGEISPNVSIYLLYSANHHIAVAQNDLLRPASCQVVAIEPYTPIDLAMKAGLVNAAVKEIGLASRVIVF